MQRGRSTRQRPASAPPWLQGWWQVAFRGSTYFYCFDTGNGVKYSRQGVGGMVAGATPGQPIASYVRWSLDSQDSATWVACFRITMSAI